MCQTTINTGSNMTSSELPTFPPDQLYVYDLPKKILNSLELMYFDSLTTEAVPIVPLTTESLEANNEKLTNKEIKESKLSGCLTCGLSSDDEDIIRDHYKSDYHRFNIKRKLNNLPTVNEEEFDVILENLEESISGSESSEDQDALETIYEKATVTTLENLRIDEEGSSSFMNTKSPYILFKSALLPSTKCFGIFKSSFTTKALESDPLLELLKWNNSNQSSKYSALLMIGGGHFAGAIVSHKRKSVKGNTGSVELLLEQSVDIVEHKTFHRYTTRRKQGGSQSASDNARGKAKSAGSSLRRYNEQALEKEVRELLLGWKKYFNQCESIFVRANGSSNRNIMIGYEGAVLKNDDPRIRSFPFTTKRATTSELSKAWVSLSYLRIMDIPKTDEKARQKLLKQQESLANSTKVLKKESKEKTEDEKHSDELILLINRSKAPALISYVRKHKISPDFKLQPELDFIATPTLLHYSASNGHVHMTQILLTNLKSNPCIKNHLNRTPYDLASSRQIKQVFRIARFNLGESYCDWEDAHVGEAKSKELFLEEEDLARELDELEKKRLIEEELAKHKQEVSEQREKKFGPGKNLGVITSLANDMSQLSDLQKARLMREQRARAAEERMKRMSSK